VRSFADSVRIHYPLTAVLGFIVLGSQVIASLATAVMIGALIPAAAGHR
jgi:hypothetical protein